MITFRIINGEALGRARPWPHPMRGAFGRRIHVHAIASPGTWHHHLWDSAFGRKNKRLVRSRKAVQIENGRSVLLTHAVQRATLGALLSFILFSYVQGCW